MTIAPLFGPDHGPRFMPPLTGLKLSRVAGYGNVEIECRGGVPGGVAILPLHIGYIQDNAQNHALCRSAILGSGQKRMFDDACCVQQAQGGYLEGRDQWFFVLPIELRQQALALRGQKSFQKLWGAISALSAKLGLPARGHLEQIICRERHYLTQFSSRFELCEGQTGALFFIDDKLVGVELAPNPAYFAEAWMPLVCFSYGVLAKAKETARSVAHSRARSVDAHSIEASFDAESLDELRQQLLARREVAASRTLAGLAALPALRGERARSTHTHVVEDERYIDLRLSTITSDSFGGQMVETENALVYLSLSATPTWLDAIA